MLLVAEANGLLEVLFVFVGILVGVLVSYFGMVYSSKFSKSVGKEGVCVVTRIMAIIVLAIAIQFVINGITEATTKFATS